MIRVSVVYQRGEKRSLFLAADQWNNALSFLQKTFSCKACPGISCFFLNVSIHFDHVESVLELVEVQLLQEEALMVISGCIANPHIAVVVHLLAVGDLIEQAEIFALYTRQVSHGRIVFQPVWMIWLSCFSSTSHKMLSK